MCDDEFISLAARDSADIGRAVQRLGRADHQPLRVSRGRDRQDRLRHRLETRDY